MGYLMEAILLILAVVLPLSFVLIFLRRLISNLGDATHAHQLKNLHYPPKCQKTLFFLKS
ncbi:hypothetical protein [Bacillus thuringiensis]|uniref:hypothetical protein n=1 Tax=Bacillus thuringiensis TaxID=1428 RepID=UPI0005B3011A|nr:hypothetical protein [Bacillus thuringiensis]